MAPVPDVGLCTGTSPHCLRWRCLIVGGFASTECSVVWNCRPGFLDSTAFLDFTVSAAALAVVSAVAWTRADTAVCCTVEGVVALLE